MESWFILFVLLVLILLCLILCFLRWRSTRTFGGKVENLQKPLELSGSIAPNNRITDALLLLKDQIDGPESLLVEDEGGTIYTGTKDAKIVKIVNGKIEKYLHLMETGLKAGTYSSGPKVGRVLGIRRLSQDWLVVADAYLGVFKVDFDRAIVTKLYSNNLEVDGKESKFLNDLEILNNGRIVVTDSSVKYGLRNVANVIIENAPDGRVLEIEPSTGNTKVLIDGLHFANGIQMHPDQLSLLIAETSMFRIRRYYFDGPQKGKMVEFADNLPGFPDNIRISLNKNSFYVGIFSVRSDVKPSIVDKLNDKPLLRRMITTFVPKRLLAITASKMMPKYGLVLELDLNGKILQSFHDPSGGIGMISQASDTNHFLLLGSPENKFIAQIPKI